jgi:hypothetical protein
MDPGRVRGPAFRNKGTNYNSMDSSRVRAPPPRASAPSYQACSPALETRTQIKYEGSRQNPRTSSSDICTPSCWAGSPALSTRTQINLTDPGWVADVRLGNLPRLDGPAPLHWTSSHKYYSTDLKSGSRTKSTQYRYRKAMYVSGILVCRSPPT